MDSIATAALASWALDPRAIALLLLAAFFYLRGWLRIRRLLLDERDVAHLDR